MSSRRGTPWSLFEHGVWLIGLAPLSDPRLVPSTLATALGVEIRSENPVPGLIAVLKDKRMLLVFDNSALLPSMRT
jgi:predicted ATPase